MPSGTPFMGVNQITPTAAAAQSFILPANGIATPQSVARRRKLAETLMSQGMDYSPVQSPWQAAARIAQAGIGGYSDYKAGQQEQAGLKSSQEQMAALLQNGDPSNADIMTAANNPWITDTSGRLASALMEQKYKKSQPDWQTEKVGNDVIRFDQNAKSPTPQTIYSGGPKATTAPVGYRWGADGTNLEPIPGGPASPSSDESSAIADAIINGDQPPDTRGLYRMGAPVRAELAKRGFDMSKAQLDYESTKRSLATMNGPQQLRLRQAIGTLKNTLPSVRELAGKWKAGGFPLLNRAEMLAAMEGGMGPEAQSIATQLNAQITDVTAELGNIYMGGNSPTDHSLDLAAKSLNANWSEKTLNDMVDLAEKNVRYRENSLNLSTAGFPESQYNPVQGQQPAAVPPMDQQPQTPQQQPQSPERGISQFYQQQIQPQGQQQQQGGWMPGPNGTRIRQVQ